MGWEGWLTLVVVAATVVVLARDLLPSSVTVLGATVVLLVAGVIDTEQALAGFSNPAPVTVAALYVLAKAVEVTGAMDPVVGRVLGTADPTGTDAGGSSAERAGRDARRRLARLVGPTALASAVLNNTPIVAMLAPQVSAWAKRHGVSSAPLLMPLSFAAILGGVVTAIGTSTNLVVSGLLEEAGRPPMGMFEISRVGVPVSVVGLVLLVVLAPRVLRDRRPPADNLAEAREFSVALRVVEGGPLDGISVDDAGLRHLQGVYLVRIIRGQYSIAPVAPDELLAGDDVLTFVGKVDLIVDLQRKRGLVSAEEQHIEGLTDTRQAFYEVVLGQSSPLVGGTLKSFGFRGRYDGAVLALHRAGQRVDAKLGEVPLRVGDTLLLLADRSFYSRWRDSPDFLLVAPLGGTPPARTRKAPAVLAMGALLVIVAGSGLLPILQASLVVAFALVAVGAVTLREAREAVDINVIVIIAAAFGLGAAVESAGLADELASLLVGALEPLGTLGALAGVLLATLALTELITNNAAAVLMFPIAVSSATALGVDARPFTMAVAVASSASFLTPIGYQTNTMVYGLGGYRFSDYPRLGVPLTIAVFVTSLLVIPVAWPM